MLAGLGVDVFVSLDVLIETMCAGHSGIQDRHRLTELLRPLRRLLPILHAFPFTAEIIANWSWRELPSTFPDATRLARTIVSSGNIDPELVDHTHKTTQELRRNLVAAGRSARAVYLDSRDSTLPDPSFAQTVRDILRKHSVIRDHRRDLVRLSRNHGHRVPPARIRVLRDPVLQYFGLAYVYITQRAAVAPNNRVIKAYPGHNDLGQLPLFPLCDALVTDDEEFRTAAITVRDYLGQQAPWVASYSEFQAHVLTA